MSATSSRLARAVLGMCLLPALGAGTLTVSLFPPAHGPCAIVTVNGGGTPTPDDPLKQISWNWGDGTISTSFFPATHRYLQGGTFQVTATLTLTSGITITASTTVQISQADAQLCAGTSSVNPKLYVANLTSPPTTVSVMDPVARSLLHNISLTSPVGRQGPEHVALSPDGSRLYTASDPIYVIDTATDTVVDSIALPADLQPIGVNNLAVDPGNTRLYVATGTLPNNQQAGRFGTVLVYNFASRGFVQRIPVGPLPANFLFSPDGRRLYLTYSGVYPTIDVIDTSGDRLTDSIPLPTPSVQSDAAALSPDGQVLYVSQGGLRAVWAVNLKTRQATSIAVPQTVTGLCLSADGKFLYVVMYLSSPESYALTVIDTATAAPPTSYSPFATDHVFAGSLFGSAILSADGTEIYLSSGFILSPTGATLPGWVAPISLQLCTGPDFSHLACYPPPAFPGGPPTIFAGLTRKITAGQWAYGMALLVPHASKLKVLSGDGQSASLGAPFASPLVARVLDSVGNGVAGVPVTFTVTSGGGSLLKSTVTTDSNGAAANLFVASGTPGDVIVQASTPGLPSVTFTGTVAASGLSFQDIFSGPPSSLSLTLASVNSTSLSVSLNGVDIRAPAAPFTFIWGDGQVTTGFFPQQHTYSRVGNYIVTVIADYGSQAYATAQILVRMIPPSIQRAPLTSGYEVSLATSTPAPLSRLLYAVPNTLVPFSSADFAAFAKADIEYTLSAIASVQIDMVNGGAAPTAGGMKEQIWKDSTGGFYTLWYAAPVSVAAGNQSFSTGVPWSSLAHEMGHNFTLNFPSTYIYGGKIDGNANAIYSETMAQIFQHAALFEVAANAGSFGLPIDLAFDLTQSARQTLATLRVNADAYTSSGNRFVSWNDPATPEDETLGTFMTLAYRFLSEVDAAGKGYRAPVKRLMTFLQRLNPSWVAQYSPAQQSAQGEAFRATLLVAAISYGAGRDMRPDFRALGFPIDDAVYQNLNIGLDDGRPFITDVGDLPTFLGPISPAGLIVVTGTNLSPTTRSWNAGDINGSQLPLSLDTVTVTIDGKPAAISYISSTQINAQAPDIASTATSVVQVKSPAGFSNTYTVDARRISPTLWTLPAPNDRYIAAFHTDGVVVGPPNLYGGALPSRPALPGETLLLYGTGFGPTSPAVAAGIVPSGNPLLVGPLQVTVGGVTAPVLFDGLISPGLIQFNVTVPSVLAQDQPVVMTINSVKGAQQLFLTVGSQ